MYEFMNDNGYRVKKPGDVLVLSSGLSYAEPGVYVLLSIDDFCCLAVAHEDASGNVGFTSDHMLCSIADLSLFCSTGITVDPL